MRETKRQTRLRLLKQTLPFLAAEQIIADLKGDEKSAEVLDNARMYLLEQLCELEVEMELEEAL